MSSPRIVPLYRAAHGRTGDKGNRSNISVIAWHPALWPLLVEQVTEARGRGASSRTAGPTQVTRHLLPQAAGDELRARRGARRRRQRRAQPRQPRQGAVLPAARPADRTCPPNWPRTCWQRHGRLNSRTHLQPTGDSDMNPLTITRRTLPRRCALAAGFGAAGADLSGPSRSPSSCPSPPAAPPTSWRARSASRSPTDTKQAVVVDNKAGASGMLAAQAAARAAGRRLHRADHHQHHARGQRAPLQEAALRPGEGLRARHRPRQGRPGAGGQRRLAVQERGRAAGRCAKKTRASSASAAAARPAASPASCSSR